MSYKGRFNCLKFSKLATFLLFFQFSNAQKDFTALDQLVNEKAKALGTEVVLMVANKDTIVYQKDTKTFSANRGQAPISYSSQWLTAALVLKMVDEGKISLDDKVSQYLPIFSSYMKNYITIRHCLSHFTGIQSEGNKVLKVFEKKRFASLEEEVNEFAKKHIQANAGEEFRYSNIGLNIAARVLEVATKKKFDMLMQQKLLRPLGMRATTFTTIDGSAINPSNGARSSAGDYMRFLTMLLNNGMYKGERILSEQSVAELRKIHTTPSLIKYAPAEMNGYSYALGTWSLDKADKQANILSAPSYETTVPVLDYCRGYAFIFLVKDLKDEQKTKIADVVKEILDSQFNNTCN